MKKVIIFISILFFVYFIYQGIHLIYYHVDPNFKVSFDIYNILTIRKKDLQNSDYFEFKNMKIRDDFKNYERLESNVDSDTSPKLVMRDENQKVIKTFWMGFADTYVYLLQADKTLFGTKDMRIVNTDLASILEENNIDNDIELFQYLWKQKNVKTNIFTSVKQMKENYVIQRMVSVIMPVVDNITLINGDYEGYIFNLKNNMKEVSILKNNQRYIFIFMNTHDLTDEYLTDILGTIVIE